jgi:hypothetical protein
MSTAVPDVDPATAGTRRPSLGAVPLHPMSPQKLVVLSLCTLGFYQLFWFYRNWRLVRDEGGEQVAPWIRTLFAPLTAFSLFDDVESLARRSRVPIHWSPIPLGIAYFLLSSAWRLPDPYSLVWLSSCVPLAWVQLGINEVNAQCERPKEVDRSFTAWNWLTVVVGGVLLLLALIGILFPPEV